MANIIINGVPYVGDRVEVRGGVVFVDGKQAAQPTGTVLEVRVTEGVLQELIADGSVNCGEVRGNVTAGGSVNCDNVGGGVRAGGSVNCDTVGGNIMAGGSVRHR